MIRGFSAFLLLLLLVACGHDQPLTGEVPIGPLGLALTLTPDEVALGTPAKLSVQVRRDQGVVADFPNIAALLKSPDVAVKKESSRLIDLPAGAQVECHDYALYCFKTGPYEIPEIRVSGKRGPEQFGAGVEPKTLTVVTILENQEEDIERPAKALDLPQRVLWPWFVGGALLLALIIVFLIRRRRKNAITGPTAPFLPPSHVEALAALAEIRQRPRETVGAIELMVVDTSRVIRRYIERRFGLHAPERTTEEFLFEAGASGQLTEMDRELLAAFLFECDKAKFAGWTPPPDRQTALLDTAEGFVKRTAPGGEVNP